MGIMTIAAAYCVLPVSLFAQELHFQPPGIPRTPVHRPPNGRIYQGFGAVCRTEEQPFISVMQGVEARKQS